MDREILFRGKRLDNGEWVTGDRVLIHGESFIYCDSVISTPKYGETDRFGVCGYKVDPSTVGQYTGLTDKHGKRIFEGDILRFDDGYEYDDNERAVMVWMDGGFWLEYHNGQTQPFYEAASWTAPSHENFETIGNVHDNPELVEEENNG